jgi:hypothetical protein
MTGNQSGNETARNLVPEKRSVRISVCALRCQGAGKIEKGLSWPASALNCTSSAASSAAASASRPGSIVTKWRQHFARRQLQHRFRRDSWPAILRAHKLSLHDSQLFDLVTLLQTFRQTVERPNIIRVLCTPLNSTAQSQIVAIDLLSLAVMALLSQQSCKRMRG